MKKQIKCMKDLKIFDCLNDDEKKEVVRLARPRFFKKGESFFAEGSPCDAIYFIRTGRVLLYKISENGKEVGLDILQQDDIFGENTILEDVYHTFSAKALEDTFACICLRSDFFKLLNKPDIALKVIQDLTTKLNSYTEQMANLAFNDVRGRILNILRRLVRKHGQITSEGIKININLSHQDIANLVNASRVMVSNVLKNLRNEGKIIINQKNFFLIDKELIEEAKEYLSQA
ncbi:Crp/Fnr family transcriptional regulator [Wukongibacter baidiensis]|uniref:Crp/Fnr family transcriptional regulator n=1 Tax=Wukongibacter baidiensis TaxID=1723361 RepID=UPI003D7F9016